MRDYWLNKLFFDIQQPALAAEYKKDRDRVLARYPMSAELRRAVLADDVAALVPHVNAYLLRFYFAICGMKAGSRSRGRQPTTVVSSVSTIASQRHASARATRLSTSSFEVLQ